MRYRMRKLRCRVTQKCFKCAIFDFQFLILTMQDEIKREKLYAFGIRQEMCSSGETKPVSQHLEPFRYYGPNLTASEFTVKPDSSKTF